MLRFKVFVTDDRYGDYGEERGVLGGIDASLEVLSLSSEAEALEALREADGILVNLFPMTAGIIRGLERCKVISRYGVGFDNVDVEAATSRGIWVARVPDYSIEEVSDHALALLLSCARGLALRDRQVRGGAWDSRKKQRLHRIAGSTLGIIGYGAIGRRLHRKAKGLGFSRILVHDPYLEPSFISAEGAEAVELGRLLAEADFLSIHVPLSPETLGLIGASELAAMKPGAILVNTSRGKIVDENALADALLGGRLAAAGLDVFASEPLPATSPLRAAETAVFSDHAGWYSEESLVELKTKAAENVASVLSGGRPRYPVNEL